MNPTQRLPQKGWGCGEFDRLRSHQAQIEESMKGLRGVLASGYPERHIPQPEQEDQRWTRPNVS
jgi:hypothetical protein